MAASTAKKTAEPASITRASKPAPARLCCPMIPTATTRAARAPHCQSPEGMTAKTIHGKNVRRYDMGFPRSVGVFGFLFRHVKTRRSEFDMSTVECRVRGMSLKHALLGL